MGDTLEERLKSHARAFEGLMSLIPAKEYYGKDESITSTQWLKRGKKQTLEERQAAKRAKLDPASHKSAKDVMDENARKRKRELEEQAFEAESSNINVAVEKEKPMEGAKKAKKQKIRTVDEMNDSGEEIEGRTLNKSEAKAVAKAEKRKEKRKEQQIKKQKKRDATKAKNSKITEKSNAKSTDENGADEGMEEVVEHLEDRIEALDVSGLVDEGQSTAPSTEATSNASTTSVASAASSASSIPTPSYDDLSSKKVAKKPLKLDEHAHEHFRARLNARLEAMRAARKADGPNGYPARNRAELIEARRKKEAERRAAKKANRAEMKEDEARQKAEEDLARIRGGSGSPSMFPALSPEKERNFNFGKVAWEDGQQLESNLSSFLKSRKKKGKSDAKTALEAAQKKHTRISGLDEAKRKDIQEKDLWLNAKKRAQGERVFDDVGLLKKSLKRQMKAKEKSKQEWKDRLTTVEKGKEAKQRKREENLRKRREEKGQKGKKKVKKPGKKVKRPGFEGTFKSR